MGIRLRVDYQLPWRLSLRWVIFGSLVTSRLTHCVPLSACLPQPCLHYIWGFSLALGTYVPRGWTSSSPNERGIQNLAPTQGPLYKFHYCCNSRGSASYADGGCLSAKVTLRETIIYLPKFRIPRRTVGRGRTKDRHRLHMNIDRWASLGGHGIDQNPTWKLFCFSLYPEQRYMGSRAGSGRVWKSLPTMLVDQEEILRARSAILHGGFHSS